MKSAFQQRCCEIRIFIGGNKFFESTDAYSFIWLCWPIKSVLFTTLKCTMFSLYFLYLSRHVFIRYDSSVCSRYAHHTYCRWYLLKFHILSVLDNWFREIFDIEIKETSDWKDFLVMIIDWDSDVFRISSFKWVQKKKH